MEWIAEWCLLILIGVTLFDTEAGILSAVLYAAAVITGPAEAAAAAGTGAAVSRLFLWLWGRQLSLKNEAADVLSNPCAYTIDRWQKYGLFMASLATMAVPAWRFRAAVTFGAKFAKQPFSAAVLAVAAFIWTLGWVLLLMPVARLLIETSSTVTAVRLILPGLTLLMILTASVSRTVLIRYYSRLREKKNENSGR